MGIPSPAVLELIGTGLWASLSMRTQRPGADMFSLSLQVGRQKCKQ
jgi:hypothetical protein